MIKFLFIFIIKFKICLFWDGFGLMVLLQLESLPSMVAGVWSDNSSAQLEATTQFRKLLSIGNFTIPYRLYVRSEFASMFKIL